MLPPVFRVFEPERNYEQFRIYDKKKGRIIYGTSVYNR